MTKWPILQFMQQGEHLSNQQWGGMGYSLTLDLHQHSARKRIIGKPPFFAISAQAHDNREGRTPYFSTEYYYSAIERPFYHRGVGFHFF